MKVAISVAHHPAARGAVFDNINEHDISIIISDLLCSYFEYVVPNIEVVFVPVGNLKDKIKFINNNNFNIAIETHLNAHISRSVFGHEVLYCPNSIKGERLAKKVNQFLSIANYTKNRGVKEGWYKMEVGGVIDYFLEKTNCPAIIIEPEFISNFNKEDIWCIVEAIGKGIRSYERSLCK